VLISGGDGGTVQARYRQFKHAGCPWELGLAEAQQVLVLNGLRDRIRVQVDGQMRTGRDVVVGALLGAEQFGSEPRALVTMGCTLLRNATKTHAPMELPLRIPSFASVSAVNRNILRAICCLSPKKSGG